MMGWKKQNLIVSVMKNGLVCHALCLRDIRASAEEDRLALDKGFF